MAGSSNHTDVFTLDDLVADTPADDAGMVAVALHHSLYVLAITRVDERRVIVGSLLCTPAVEGLVDDQHTDGVAGVEEGTRRRIMAGADEVETSLLHQLHFADFSSIEGHCPQHAVVVMHTGSINQNRFAVKHKSLLGRILDSANTVSDG